MQRNVFKLITILLLAGTMGGHLASAGDCALRSEASCDDLLPCGGTHISAWLGGGTCAAARATCNSLTPTWVQALLGTCSDHCTAACAPCDCAESLNCTCDQTTFHAIPSSWTMRVKGDCAAIDACHQLMACAVEVRCEGESACEAETLSGCAKSTPAMPTSDCASAAVLADVRTKLGGSTLQGTVFSDARRTVGAQGMQQAAADEEVFSTQIRQLDTRQHVAEPMEWAPRYATTEQPNDIEALRTMSRELDEMAHSLEERDLYQQADALRGMADLLRNDARGRQHHVVPTGYFMPPPSMHATPTYEQLPPPAPPFSFFQGFAR